MFPVGLHILIIFETLHIDNMILGGALREGLVYGMLHLPIEQDIRQRTLRNVQRRFRLILSKHTEFNNLQNTFLFKSAKVGS